MTLAWHVAYRREKMFIQGYLGVDGRIILKWVFRIGTCGVNYPVFVSDKTWGL
jgi:hypothetical protein